MPPAVETFFPAFMSLSSLIQRARRAVGARPGAEPVVATPADVEAARVRARRRLIGMLVLVGAGMVIFPTFLETQPRPVSPDVQVSRAGASAPAAGAVLPAPRVAMAPVMVPPPAPLPPDASPADDTPAHTVASAPSVAVPRPAPPPAAPKPEPKPEPKPAPRPEPKPEPKPQVATAPKPAEPRSNEASKPADARATERYVVQFGAFADPKAARDARTKLERLGIRTYAQQVDTADGKRTRVRMGPYTTRAEADKALAALRKAGLDGKVLTL